MVHNRLFSVPCYAKYKVKCAGITRNYQHGMYKIDLSHTLGTSILFLFLLFQREALAFEGDQIKKVPFVAGLPFLNSQYVWKIDPAEKESISWEHV